MFDTQGLYQAALIDARSQSTYYPVQHYDANLNDGLRLTEEQKAITESEYLDFVASLEFETATRKRPGQRKVVAVKRKAPRSESGFLPLEAMSKSHSSPQT